MIHDRGVFQKAIMSPSKTKKTVQSVQILPDVNWGYAPLKQAYIVFFKAGAPLVNSWIAGYAK